MVGKGLVSSRARIVLNFKLLFRPGFQFRFGGFSLGLRQFYSEINTAKSDLCKRKCKKCLNKEMSRFLNADKERKILCRRIFDIFQGLIILMKYLLKFTDSWNQVIYGINK